MFQDKLHVVLPSVRFCGGFHLNLHGVSCPVSLPLLNIIVLIRAVLANAHSPFDVAFVFVSEIFSYRIINVQKTMMHLVHESYSCEIRRN